MSAWVETGLENTSFTIRPRHQRPQISLWLTERAQRVTPNLLRRRKTSIYIGLGGNRIGEYEFYDPAAPPTSADLLVAYRKGATCNTELTQAKKDIDVINDQIFPTFGGFFRWNAKGQIIIDGERPADWTKLRVASEVGAIELTVNDVLPWKTTLGSPYLLHGKL